MNGEIRETHKTVAGAIFEIFEFLAYGIEGAKHRREHPFIYQKNVIRPPFRWYIRALLYFLPKQARYNEATDETAIYKQFAGKIYLLSVWKTPIPTLNCRCVTKRKGAA